MASIEIDNVSKAYRNAPAVVEHISVTVQDGEFMVLVGPSGSGKSTLLRMIAGLEEITDGEIRVDGRVVNNAPARDRDLAMVFQNYALYPHMTVAENMAFALKLRKVDKAEQQRRVNDAAALLGLEPYLNRKPSELSGGQRQRVAMGRAIVREPKAFLMDEPLSNLDAKLRVSMRGVLSALHERLGVTTVYVTHDQIEAMTLGDRVAVLADGQLQQVDTPQNLFDHPANLFVAGFIGSPAMNMVEASVVDEGGLQLRFGSYSVPVPGWAADELRALVSKRVILGIRPTSFVNVDLGEGEGWPVLEATAKAVEALGSDVNVLFEIDAPPITHESVKSLGASEDNEEQKLAVSTSGHSIWTARLSPQTEVKVGDKTRVALDLEKLHFFELETGNAFAQPQHG